MKRHAEWYKGDAWYGDGKDFHFDYYNSFVIHPMLMQVLDVVSRHVPEVADFQQSQQKVWSGVDIPCDKALKH